MASFKQVEYCPICKKTVVSNNGVCKTCGNKVNKSGWNVRFRIIEKGKLKNKALSGYKTKKEANLAYIDYMNSYTPDTLLSSNINCYDYNILYKKYLDAKRIDTKESSQYDKINIFDLYITPYFKNTKVNEYTKLFLSNWQTELWNKRQTNKENYSYAYLNKIRGYLNNFLDWCGQELEIENKLKFVKKPKNKEVKEPMVFWELEEFRYFLNKNLFNLNAAAPNEDMLWYTYFNFSFFTGLRIGEIQAFSEKDINGNTISINKTYTSKTTDGSYYKITHTKNYKQYEKTIPNELLKILTLYLQWKRINKISSKFLFGGDVPLSDKTIRRKLESYTDIANSYDGKDKIILKRITPHKFRHSYVSLLIYLGCTTKTVAELIGDNEEQVMRTYSHLYKDEKAEAINKINTLLMQSKKL